MRLSKAEAMQRWKTLPEDAPLNPDPIAYKTTGSTYGADGIRVEGTPEFVDAVLGRLKDLIAGENDTTRLGINYQSVEPREGKTQNFIGNVVCYVKTYERGAQAQVMNAFISAVKNRTEQETRSWIC